MIRTAWRTSQSYGQQPRKKDDTKSVFNAAARGSVVWHPCWQLPCSTTPDHLRVGRWDFFDDCGPTIVRLLSPRDLVSRCREQMAHCRSSSRPSDAPASSRKLTTVEITCSIMPFCPPPRWAHERLDIHSMQDGEHGTGLCTVLTCIGPKEHVVEMYL